MQCKINSEILCLTFGTPKSTGFNMDHGNMWKLFSKSWIYCNFLDWKSTVSYIFMYIPLTSIELIGCLVCLQYKYTILRGKCVYILNNDSQHREKTLPSTLRERRQSIRNPYTHNIQERREKNMHTHSYSQIFTHLDSHIYILMQMW